MFWLESYLGMKLKPNALWREWTVAPSWTGGFILTSEIYKSSCGKKDKPCRIRLNQAQSNMISNFLVQVKQTDNMTWDVAIRDREPLSSNKAISRYKNINHLANYCYLLVIVIRNTFSVNLWADVSIINGYAVTISTYSPGSFIFLFLTSKPPKYSRIEIALSETVV